MLKQVQHDMGGFRFVPRGKQVVSQRRSTRIFARRNDEAILEKNKRLYQINNVVFSFTFDILGVIKPFLLWIAPHAFALRHTFASSNSYAA